MSNQKYVMVPVEPTAEMVDRGAKEVDWYSHNARDCYAAMLAAAPQSPAVQGEPVGAEQESVAHLPDARSEFEAWITAPPYEKPVAIYPETGYWPGQYRDYEVGLAWEAWQAARAAPAVQREPVGLRQRLFNGWKGCSNHGCVVVDPKPGMMRTNGSCQCIVNASRSQLYMLQGRIQSVLSATQQPAEQQPAPDVAGLVEALEAALMVMTSKEVRLEKQADAITMVRSQLAAHQKREPGHDNQ